MTLIQRQSYALHIHRLINRIAHPGGNDFQVYISPYFTCKSIMGTRLLRIKRQMNLPSEEGSDAQAPSCQGKEKKGSSEASSPTFPRSYQQNPQCVCAHSFAAPAALTLLLLLSLLRSQRLFLPPPSSQQKVQTEAPTFGQHRYDLRSLLDCNRPWKAVRLKDVSH